MSSFESGSAFPTKEALRKKGFRSEVDIHSFISAHGKTISSQVLKDGIERLEPIPGQDVLTGIRGTVTTQMYSIPFQIRLLTYIKEYGTKTESIKVARAHAIDTMITKLQARDIPDIDGDAE